MAAGIGTSSPPTTGVHNSTSYIRGCAADQGDELAPPHHSITSSARTSRAVGTVRPSALAVVRLMTSSNFVGCSTGISAGRRRPGHGGDGPAVGAFIILEAGLSAEDQMMRDFVYRHASSLDEARRLACEQGAMLLAGGQTLLRDVKLGRRPEALPRAGNPRRSHRRSRRPQPRYPGRCPGGERASRRLSRRL